MSEHRVLILRNSLVATCAFAALILLASFYSIVSGAVDRAARHRLAAADITAPAATVLATRTVSRRASLFARSDN